MGEIQRQMSNPREAASLRPVRTNIHHNPQGALGPRTSAVFCEPNGPFTFENFTNPLCGCTQKKGHGWDNWLALPNLTGGTSHVLC